MDHYNVVGQNNRNVLVQSNKIAPYHEDITRVQPFEPASVSPGVYSRIKLDFKHAMDRELILNDLRLKFNVNFPVGTGKVLAIRGTDLIRELVVKINEDVVFKCDKKGELSFLWEMNNHRTSGDIQAVDHSMLLNHGNIPSGDVKKLTYDGVTKGWTYGINGTNNDFDGLPWTTQKMTVPGHERHDGWPRIFFDDTAGQEYSFKFNISLNQLVGPIFHRLHMRRVEYVQIEIMFEPFISKAMTQNFLLFTKDPAAIHPYSLARFENLEIQQYRTTLLDGICGFTLPDNKMLSWLMHRYSRREYNFDFTNPNATLDIQLHDWEIRTNIVRVWWMLAPLPTDENQNAFRPPGQTDAYDALFGVEILWKNDKVLDLANTYDVYRHYILSDNKRYNTDNPFMKYSRLIDRNVAGHGANVNRGISDGEIDTWRMGLLDKHNLGFPIRYEYPVYHVDLNMNVQQGVPGAEIIGGIVNDTSDYVIRLKKVTDRPTFSTTIARTVWVWIEYQTLVNLAANSNQFNRGSQVITKQLNPQ